MALAGSMGLGPGGDQHSDSFKKGVNVTGLSKTM